MFFIVSKIFWTLVQPSNAIGFGLLIGMLVCATRWKTAGLWVAGVSAVTYVAVIWLPVGHLLVAPLEDRFPIEPAIEEPVAGILMLSGPIDSQTTIARGQVSIHGGAERYLEFVRLMLRYPDARGIVTGGTPTLTRDSEGQASYGRLLLENIGFDVSRVTFETQARNTYENVLLTMPVADPGSGDGRWIVVTSAYHMPRAMGVLAAQGWDAVAWPTDYQTEGKRGRLFFTSAAGESLGLLDVAVKEWIGLGVYYLTGKIDSLFPGPQ